MSGAGSAGNRKLGLSEEGPAKFPETACLRGALWAGLCRWSLKGMELQMPAQRAPRDGAVAGVNSERFSKVRLTNARQLVRAVVLAVSLAALACAQQFQFNLDHLTAKASETVDLSLNGATLQFAAKFLDSKDPDQNKVKKLIAGLEGIYVRSFEFKHSGEWSPSDLDAIRKQLKAPEWSKIVGVKSTAEGETAEIYLRNENGKITGVAILASEPKELTVVNIAGPVDLDSLANLGGHMGIPKVDIPKQK